MYTTLLVGTSKGLLILSNKNATWKIRGVQFEGLQVSMIYIDDRTNTWWVGISHRHWGEKLHHSNNEGKSWQEVTGPNYGEHLYRPGKPATLRKLWVIRQAGEDKPGGLWLGTEPGGLFYSTDYGKYFQLVESLWNLPGRMDDNQWFGTGKDSPFIHSILVDPRDSEHIYVGVSCAGVFETRDGGKKWEPKNKGLIAAYLPIPDVPVGHDPHCMLLCPANPEIIWQQNHCGIFRTTDGGANWKDVSGKNGFPCYGFALAIDEGDSNTAWVIPATSDAVRVPPGLQLTVCKTSDGGNSWTPIRRGLPVENAFDLVLRHGFLKKGKILAFGTNNGNLYLSEDAGNSWEIVSQNLAAVNCLASSDI